MKRSIITVAFAAMLTAINMDCSAEPLNPPVDGLSSAAAYGNISLPAGNITNVVLYKVGEGDEPPIEVPLKAHTFAHGDFFIENLEPGKYFLKVFSAGKAQFDFNYRGVSESKFVEENAIEVKPGSVTYMGSYVVTGLDQKLKKTDDFEITQSKSAPRMFILGRIKSMVRGAGWDKILNWATR